MNRMIHDSKRLGALCPCMSMGEMSTARATVAFILSQRNSSEQLGSVGQRKLFLCHQWAFVCNRASVHLGEACTNTPAHRRVVTDIFLKSVCPTYYKNVKCVRKKVIIKNDRAICHQLISVSALLEKYNCSRTIKITITLGVTFFPKLMWRSTLLNNTVVY